MRLSAAFKLFTPELISERLTIFSNDYVNRENYTRLAKEIAKTPEENIELVLTRDKDRRLCLAGIKDSDDCFKLMPREILGNLDSGDCKLKLADLVGILEDYCWFRIQ